MPLRNAKHCSAEIYPEIGAESLIGHYVAIFAACKLSAAAIFAATIAAPLPPSERDAQLVQIY